MAITKEGCALNKFVIDRDDGKMQSINRTIRIKPEYFDKLMSLSEQTGVSFNKIINQCIAFALENLDETFS